MANYFKETYKIAVRDKFRTKGSHKYVILKSA